MNKSIQSTIIGGEYEDESNIAVSQDGSRFAYTRTDADIDGNINTISLWLIEKDDPAAAREIAVPVGGPNNSMSFQPRFSPSGRKLAYLTEKAVVVQPTDGTASVEIKPEGAAVDCCGERFEPKAIQTFAWSPDGNRVAMIITGQRNTEIRSGIELGATDSYGLDPNQAPSKLAIYDLKSGRWKEVSPNSINVDSFDWAPDGERIAYAGSPAERTSMPYMYNDLYIADLLGRETKKIPLPPGYNSGPLWSPDARWIAFQSQGGRVRYLAEGRIGLYEVAHDKLTYPAYDELGSISGFKAVPIDWSPDSSSLLIRVPYHLSKQLFKLSIPQGHLSRFTQGDDQNFYAGRYQSSSSSAIVFLKESFFQAPNIYVSPADRFRPRRVTAAKSGLSQDDVQVREIEWPSRDGRWSIHGWLLLPKAVPQKPLPLLVFAEGGPTMVSPRFRTGWSYPIHALVDNGVAVLVPNSRGRGGFGEGFQMAWEAERNPGQGPLEDDLAGVDSLIETGIVDPDRIALAGHSWGGYLAAYALTHTARFKAIFVNEGVSLNMMEEGLAIASNPPFIEFARQLGKGMPFDDDDADRLRRLSPIYQVANAKTPALLEFGADSLIKDGDALFQGLKHFNVPSELISYPRSGHGTTEPALLYDAARRDLEWFAYWVLGKPTQRMLDRYGPAPISEWLY